MHRTGICDGASDQHFRNMFRLPRRPSAKESTQYPAFCQLRRKDYSDEWSKVWAKPLNEEDNLSGCAMDQSSQAFLCIRNVQIPDKTTTASSFPPLLAKHKH